MSLVKISKLFDFEKGSLQSSKCVEGKYTFITAAEEWKSHNDYDHECEALVFAAAASGSLGRIHYINGKFVASDLCFVLTPKNQTEYPIDLQFYYFIFTQLRNEIVRNTKAGTSKEAIGLKSFGNYELPYLNIEQQKRVRIAFSNSSIIKNNLITEQVNQLDLLKKLRKQILKDAIQGKLVKQNSEDEPAKEFLKKIKQEKERLIKEKKIKREKPLPSISEDEIPFGIPHNWEWCRLNDISEIGTGATPLTSRADYYKDGTIPWITSSATNKLFVEVPELYITEKALKETNCTIYPVGTLIVAMYGQGKTRGQITEIKFDAATNQACATISLIQKYDILNKYIKIFFQYNYENLRELAQGGSQPNLNMGKIKNTAIPIPPLAEQERIVKRVDELMELCDQLEKAVIQNQEITEKLYQSALKEALQPKLAKKIPLPVYCSLPERTILAGYILNQCYAEDFGRVKFMKLLYLVEHACHLDFNSQYVVKAAGPYDEKLIKEVEQKLSQMNFYKVQQDRKDNRRVHYTQLGHATELDNLFNTHFVTHKKGIDNLLSKFKSQTWDYCEIIATLYAVWNNRILNKELVNDVLLKQDFLDWDKNKTKYKNRLDEALTWMRDNEIIPIGYGKLIEKPISYAE